MQNHLEFAISSPPCEEQVNAAVDQATSLVEILGVVKMPPGARVAIPLDAWSDFRTVFDDFDLTAWRVDMRRPTFSLARSRLQIIHFPKILLYWKLDTSVPIRRGEEVWGCCPQEFDSGVFSRELAQVRFDKSRVARIAWHPWVAYYEDGSIR